MRWLFVTFVGFAAACSPPPSEEEKTIEAAKAAVAAELRDPSSAQFRSVKFNNSVVCGEVNGKNGFGAYAGFTSFVYQHGMANIYPESTDPNDPYDVYKLEAFFAAEKLCKPA